MVEMGDNLYILLYAALPPLALSVEYLNSVYLSGHVECLAYARKTSFTKQSLAQSELCGVDFREKILPSLWL